MKNLWWELNIESSRLQKTMEHSHWLSLETHNTNPLIEEMANLYARAEEFTFNPDQARDEHGRWASDGSTLEPSARSIKEKAQRMRDKGASEDVIKAYSDLQAKIEARSRRQDAIEKGNRLLELKKKQAPEIL